MLPYRTREMRDFLANCSERRRDSHTTSTSAVASSERASSEQSTITATDDAFTTPNQARLPVANHCRRFSYACSSSRRSASFRASSLLQYTGGFPSALQRKARGSGLTHKSLAI